MNGLSFIHFDIILGEFKHLYFNLIYSIELNMIYLGHRGVSMDEESFTVLYIELRYPYRHFVNKANLRDLIAATGLVILLKIGFKSSILARVTLQLDGWPRKIIGHLF